MILKKPGKFILASGFILYLVALAASLAGSALDIIAAEESWRVLLFMPLMIAASIVALSWGAFFIGTITGTPLISFTYGWAAMKRNWAGIVGAILFVTVILAAIMALMIGWI
jgi:hypothetical protein